MARAPRFTIAAIADLLKQLRYAPASTRLRQMDAAEALAGELDTSINYPEAYVVYRVTGYRPDDASTTTFVGEALLGDLVTFVLHISRDLHLQQNHDGRNAQTIEQCAETLGVSIKTLQRYRRRGLICHYVYFNDQQRLACFDDALAQFQHAHDDTVSRAAGFQRITEAERQRIIDTARALHDENNSTLNEAATQLCDSFSRARETLRLILKRHDRTSTDPIFTDPGRVDARRQRLIHRAWQRGVAVSTLAKRFDRTATTIHRTIHRQRALLLGELSLEHITLPTFSHDHASQVILSHRAVTRNLNDGIAGGDALQLIETARTRTALDEDAEHAMIAGYNFLKRRAAQTIAQLGHWPGAQDLDAAETDLRWAERIKQRLVSAGFPSGLHSIEQHLHRPLSSQPGEGIVRCIELAIDVVSSVVERIDPSTRQRLDRMARHAVDRALARQRDIVHPDRAAAKHTSDSVVINSPLQGLTAWHHLQLPPSLHGALDQLNKPLRELVIARYGLHGQPPQTCAALAAQRSSSDAAIARLLAQAHRQLRAHARGAHARAAESGS